MKKFKIILEFSEFNAMRMNSDNSLVSVGTTTDPSQSVNAFDKHQDAIRVGMSRINNIMKSLSDTSTYRDLKSKFTLENQKPTQLKILRIIPNNIDYYIYLTFIIEDVEYNGVIQNIFSNTKFISNVYKNDSLVQTDEWRIRLKGLIIDSFKKWINIESGSYKALKDGILCFNCETGNIRSLNINESIEVIRTIMSENKIIIKINNNPYFLSKDNFIYFNYWFEKISI